ncbi:hypothetical protein ACP70R_036012 [Stipagrostis hirtigluma subsp. patula]
MASFTSSYRWIAEYAGLLKSALALLLGSLVASLCRRAIQPPPPLVCGAPGGPPVTSTRVTLRDGRRLAYLETGVPRAEAKHKIIFVHRFDACRHDVLPVSPELLEELGACVVSYDRPGYGESDPDPARTERSNALDVQDLADALGLGDRFHVVGHSMGGQVVWSCLRHIPHRLAGAALLAPVANFWWRGFPAAVSAAAFRAQPPRDRWAVRVAHHAPWLTYWWNTQRWFPPSSAVARSRRVLSPPDLKVISDLLAAAGPHRRRPNRAQVRQQRVFESLHRDMMVAFGDWDWSPLELSNPAPGKDAAVHLWHGADDLVVAPAMSRHIARELPWIRYHELPDAGHLFPLAGGMADVIIKSLLVGE